MIPLLPSHSPFPLLEFFFFDFIAYFCNSYYYFFAEYARWVLVRVKGLDYAALLGDTSFDPTAQREAIAALPYPLSLLPPELVLAQDAQMHLSEDGDDIDSDSPMRSLARSAVIKKMRLYSDAQSPMRATLVAAKKYPPKGKRDRHTCNALVVTIF